MYQPHESLEDRVSELAGEWVEYAASYRRHAVALLDRFWAYGSDAASADLGAGSDLMIHLAQLVVIEGMLDHLLGVLEHFQSGEPNRYVPRPQATPGSGSGET